MKRNLHLDQSPSKRTKSLTWYQRLFPFLFTPKEMQASQDGEEEVEKSLEADEDCQIVRVVEKGHASKPVQFSNQHKNTKEETFNSNLHRTPVKSPLFQTINETPNSSPSQHARLSWMNSTARTSTPSSSRSSRLGIASHRLSSVRKQGAKKQTIVIEKLKKQFVPGYRAAAVGGFTGTPQDYEGLIDYMHRGREAEIKLGLPDEKLEPFELKVEPAKNQDTIHELLWIAELRDRINQALNTPEIPLENLQIRDEKFRELIKREKETEEKIKELLAPQKVVKDLFPPLSPEDLKKVDHAQRGEGTVVDKFSLAIQKKDLRTLSGSSWLNDEVINFYAELVMDRAKSYPEKYPKIHVFNTFFYHILSTKGYTGVRRWSKKVYYFDQV
jgi:Ulp1 family protease